MSAERADLGASDSLLDLCLAVKRGDKDEVARLLVEKRLNPNDTIDYSDDDGKRECIGISPLHFVTDATNGGEIIQLLTSHGADPSSKCKMNFYSIQDGKSFISSTVEDLTPLHLAQTSQAVEALCAAEADRNARATKHYFNSDDTEYKLSEGLTPLFTISKNRSEAILRLLGDPLTDANLTYRIETSEGEMDVGILKHFAKERHLFEGLVASGRFVPPPAPPRPPSRRHSDSGNTTCPAGGDAAMFTDTRPRGGSFDKLKNLFSFKGKYPAQETAPSSGGAGAAGGGGAGAAAAPSSHVNFGLVPELSEDGTHVAPPPREDREDKVSRLEAYRARPPLARRPSHSAAHEAETPGVTPVRRG